MDGETSSADPQALLAFSEAGTRIEAGLDASAARLAAVLDQFAATCREYPVGVDSRLADPLRALARRDGEHARWVRRVAEGFILADQEASVGTGLVMGSLDGETSVADWEPTARVEAAMERALRRLPAALAEQLRALLTPENVAALVVILGIWAGAQAFGVGEVVDLILAVGGLIMLGPEAIRAVGELVGFATGALNARSEADLDQAGEHLANAVAIVGVDGVLALLTHRAASELGPKVPTLDPSGPRLVPAEGPGPRVGPGGGRPAPPGPDADPFPDQPRVVRQDNDFRSPVNSRGVPKSYLDEDGALIPADVDGDTTPVQHVFGMSPAKDVSPYTSFQAAPGGGKVYGRMQIELDLPRLEQDIASGKVQGVEVVSTPRLQAQLEGEIHAIAPDVDVPAATANGLRGIDDYVAGLQVSASAAERVRRRLVAYFNVTRDQEILVRGIIPGEYVSDPAPAAPAP